MSLKLNVRLSEYLNKYPKKQPTARDVAEWVFGAYPKECEEKRKKSKATKDPIDTDKKLIQALVAEIGSNYNAPSFLKKYPQIKRMKLKGERSFRYYLAESVRRGEVSKFANSSVSTNEEEDMYPLLSKFLKSDEFEQYEGIKVYSKRIDEKTQTGKSSTRKTWLYPDLVGIENLSHDWRREVKDCVQEYSDKKAKLWSFEVKAILHGGNVRESFFQAVSNSSWANFGYLVAGDISGKNTLKVLRMLASLHGIGFILLKTGNLQESQIMIPAKERSQIDWDTANELAGNNDFLKYIESVLNFYKTNKIHPADWD